MTAIGRSLSPRRDEPPSGSIRINCTCCQLRQQIRDRDGAVPTICDECAKHQGQLPERRAERAESHEAMLRKRLDACRASEARSTAKADSAKERIASALASRGALAARLYASAERSNHTCPATQVAFEPQVAAWAQRHTRETAGRNYWDDED